MGVFRDKFGHLQGNLSHREFFKGIDENPGDNWFSKLIDAVGKKDMALRRECGQALIDSKSPPLHRRTHLDCCDKLCLMNTKDSMIDKFVMVSQRVFCNRASDTSNLLWEDIKPDWYQALPRYVVEDWQQKVSDRKPVPLLPSNDDPNLSFLLALGDFLCLGGANQTCNSNTPTKHYLIPSLAHEKSSASRKITVRGILFLCWI